MITIAIFDNVMEANIIKNWLLDNGVTCFLQDEHILAVNPFLSPAVYGIKLQVDEEDEETAKEVMAVYYDTTNIQEEDARNLSGDIMNNTERILKECNALLEGHFKLTSGRHSNFYIEKIKIINQPDKVALLCKELANRLSDLEVDVVVGPAYGGIVLAFEVAKNLGKKFVFTQRKDDEMSIRSGFELEAGMKAVIIEDIVTTGGSVVEVMECLKAKGISVEAVGVIVDRSNGKTDFGVRTEALLTVDIESYEPENCPFCAENIPMSVPGSSDKK